MENKISVIFCLAPAKIGMTLECFEEEQRKKRQVYILLPLIGLYTFFLKLGLNARIIYTKDYDIKYHNYNYFQNKRNAKKIIKMIGIDEKSDVKVFFSDWVTNSVFMGLYLKELEKYPQTILHDRASRNYMVPLGGKYINRVNISKLHYLLEFIYSLVYGYHFRYSWTESFHILCLDVDYYKYKEKYCEDTRIYERYQFPLCDSGKKTVLLMTEPYRFEFQTKENYDSMNIEIVKVLKEKGYRVIMKGHPRLGNHPLLENICDDIIPAYIPSEFLDLSSVEFVIGFVSNSVCQATKYTKAYSVLPMCKIINRDVYDYFYELVNANGEGRVVMLTSYDQIK